MLYSRCNWLCFICNYFAKVGPHLKHHSILCGENALSMIMIAIKTPLSRDLSSLLSKLVPLSLANPACSHQTILGGSKITEIISPLNCGIIK